MKPRYSTKRDGESANDQELKYPSKASRAASRPEMEKSVRLNSLGWSVTKKGGSLGQSLMPGSLGR